MSENKPYEHVLIVGPGIGSFHVSYIREAWTELKVRCAILGDGEAAGIDDQTVRSTLQSLTTPETCIHYFGHGNVTEDTHDHIIDWGEIRHTASVLEAHIDLPGIRHVWSCFAGAAKKAVGDILQEDSPVILHSSKKHTTLLAMNTQSIVDITRFHHSRGKTTFYDGCAYSVVNSPETFIALVKDHAPFKATSPKTKAPLRDVVPYLNAQQGQLQSHFGLQDAVIKVTPEQQVQYHFYTMMVKINQRSPLDNMVMDNVQINATLMDGLTPLELAYRGNNMAAVRVLVAQGANVSDPTVFIMACRDGDEELAMHLADRLSLQGRVFVNAVLDAVLAAGNRQHKGIIKALLKKPQVSHVLGDIFEGACKRNDPMLQNLLFTGGVDLNGVFRNACENGAAVIVDMLLQANVVVVNQVEGSKHETPLHRACLFCHGEVVQKLVDNGAFVNIRNDEGHTALHLAAQSFGRTSSALLKAVLDGRMVEVDGVDKRGYTPLLLACDAENPGNVAALLEKGANPHYCHPTTQKTALHSASESLCEGTGIVDALLQYGADAGVIDGTGKMPIHYACDIQNAMIVMTLLKAYPASAIHPDDEGKMPLHLAAEAESPIMAQALLDVESTVSLQHVDGEGRTPLQIAVSNGNDDVVAIMLAYGADVHAVQETTGQTALHMAAHQGGVDTIDALLNQGALPNSQDKKGRTPLLVAIKAMEEEVVSVLLERGADATLADHQGITPLHMACQMTMGGVVEDLLARGANPNAVATKTGRTPMHLAAKNVDIDIMVALIERGADIHCPDKDGITPLQLNANDVQKALNIVADRKGVAVSPENTGAAVARLKNERASSRKDIGFA